VFDSVFGPNKNMKAKGVAYLSPVVKISARLKRIKTVRIWWVVNLGGLCAGN